jgi:hypothetical protein
MGLRFRRKFEQAKVEAAAPGFAWYPYDSFPNLFPLERLGRTAGLDIQSMAGAGPVLDIGAADGALSFYFESLGFPVHAIDHAGANMNRMEGIRLLRERLRSNVQVMDVDMDSQFGLDSQYGLALFLGTLYHLKNPFFALEKLAHHAQFCFVSTRVARRSPDGTTRLDQAPVAYLLDENQCNADSTNYWVFSPLCLSLLFERTGWTVKAMITSGNPDSDPASPDHDERAFALLSSRVLVPERSRKTGTV